MHSFKHHPSKRQRSLFLQSELHSLDSAEGIFMLSCLIALDIFFMQPEGVLIRYFIQVMVFGKCCFTSFKKVSSMLVLTLWLNGGLNHIT